MAGKRTVRMEAHGNSEAKYKTPNRYRTVKDPHVTVFLILPTNFEYNWLYQQEAVDRGRWWRIEAHQGL